MDDERTQHTLDALADLFLTQAARERSVANRTQDALNTPAPAPGIVPGIAPGIVPAPGITPGIPHGTTFTPGMATGISPGVLPGDDPLEGPAPIRLAPKAVPHALPRHRAQPLAQSPGAEPPLREPKLRYTGYEPVESIAGKALGAKGHGSLAEPASSYSESDVMGPPAAAEAAVEAVILGNLPGMAGPWLTQYAQALADQAGPVLILHVDEPDTSDAADRGQIEIELVEPIRQDETAPTTTIRVPPMRDGGPDQLIHLVDGLVRSRAGKVSNILVHLEADSDPARLARLAAVGHWTLLAGCDDFAVAGLTRLVGRLLDADAALAGKRIALMMMGGPDTAARAAAQAVAAEIDPLLDTPIHCLGGHQKMGPVNVRQLGVYRDLGVLWPPLLSYFRSLVPPASKPVQEAPAPPPLRAKPEFVPQDAGFQERDDVPGFQSVGAKPKPAASAATTQAAAPAPKVDIAPPPAATRSAPKPTMPTTEPPSLARLVAANSSALAGGIALEARCPFQPDTELLLDQAGVIHLLRRDIPTDATGHQSLDEAAALRAAIVDLTEARKWVIEHRQILQLTQRNARFADAESSGSEPVLHLLTDKPHLATGLVARLGSHIKLHLLQQLQLADQTAWYCTPLS